MVWANAWSAVVAAWRCYVGVLRERVRPGETTTCVECGAPVVVRAPGVFDDGYRAACSDLCWITYRYV